MEVTHCGYKCVTIIHVQLYFKILPVNSIWKPRVRNAIASFEIIWSKPGQFEQMKQSFLWSLPFSKNGMFMNEGCSFSLYYHHCPHCYCSMIVPVFFCIVLSKPTESHFSKPLITMYLFDVLYSCYDIRVASVRIGVIVLCWPMQSLFKPGLLCLSPCCLLVTCCEVGFRGG